VTLWLTAVLAAAVVLVTRPRTARQRLADCRGPTAQTSLRSGSSGAQVVLIGAAIGSGLVAMHLPIGLAAVGGVVPVGVSVVRRTRENSLRRTAGEAAVVEVTFALAAELRAGRTPKEALLAASAAAGPLTPVLSAAATAVDLGGSAAAELDAGAELPGAGRLRSIAAAWRVTEAAGGRVAVVLERLGEAMDRDDELRREMEAAMAAPRATMILLAGLPAIGIGLGQAIGADPLHLLVYRPLGWALAAGAVLLDALGIAVSRLITRWALQ
jgi:tight adherence protein B